MKNKVVVKNMNLKKIEKAVPDTSVIIEGFLSAQIEKNRISLGKVIIHEAVLSELESQANKGKEIGFIGLEEIGRIRKLGVKKGFSVDFKGNRPGDFEIKFAKSGEIDSLIRELARQEKATLITADIVQSKVAEAKGIDVFLYRFKESKKQELLIEKFFKNNVTSVHLREGCETIVKSGKPGSFKITKLSLKTTKEQILEISKDVIDNAKMREDSFVDSDKKNGVFIKIGKYKILFIKPPHSDKYELIARKSIKEVTFNNFKMNNVLRKRLIETAKGVIILGAYDEGKSTLAKALAEKLLSAGKKISVVENPRGFAGSSQISKYGANQGSDLLDTLLFSNPDYVIMDEIKSAEDFRLFSDLRNSGIKTFGVINSLNPIDALQKISKRMEFGAISNAIDAIVVVKRGEIVKSFYLTTETKIQKEKNSPLISVYDLVSGKRNYEIYLYYDEAIVSILN